LPPSPANRDEIMGDQNDTTCSPDLPGNFSTVLGETSIPEWEALLTIGTLTFFIIVTIIGNILVILSVFTYKPLRIVQNFFIVSLAVADLTVAILVLPLNVVYAVRGKWIFGIHLCKMWLTSDVMCCTASILNLCGIALDRFWAITDPINYAQKRTVKRVLTLIAGVWILSLLISSPPLIGWNDWPEPDEFLKIQVCKLTELQGYVIYSSLGSFFIPLFIMTIVTGRALAVETNHNEHPEVNGKTKDTKSKKKKKTKGSDKNTLKPILTHDDSLTDIADNSSLSQRRNSNPCTSENKGLVSSTTTITLSNNSKPSPKVVLSEPPKKTGFVYQFIEEKQRISLSKERRAARTLGIIMGVFVICWLPFFLICFIPLDSLFAENTDICYGKMGMELFPYQIFRSPDASRRYQAATDADGMPYIGDIQLCR
ncbi:hypothetical protein NQ317_016431, partial [Molorchus minor]